MNPPSIRARIARTVVRFMLTLVRLLNAGNTRLLRAQANFVALLSPVPSGIRVERVSLGGVPADLLTPHNAAPGRALMYLHGGGYTVGNPRTHRAMVARLAIQAGMKAYLPDYRLAPEHPCPAAIEDALTAWQALLALESDPVLAGESAGGGLSVRLCQRAQELGIRMPQRLYLQSPWLDLSLNNPSQHERNARDPMLKHDWLESQFARHYSAGQDRRSLDVSPQFGSAEGFPPTLIQVGTHEVLYDDARLWAEKLHAAGVTSQLFVGEGLWHAWPLFAPLVPESTQALQQAGAWLRTR